MGKANSKPCESISQYCKGTWMKNVSTGNWITITIVLINIIFMVGVMSKDVLNAQESANTALDMAYSNDKKIAVIETKIEQGFSNIEKLIRNGN